MTFEELEIGEWFRIRTPVGYASGLFCKTGPESFGLAPGEGQWDWTGGPGMEVEVYEAEQV